MSETLKIRPYARLLTMLGNQLIKDERIALIELIKNSYDADAGWVKITFSGFGDNYEVLPESKIIIQDNGNGMTKDVLSNQFLNPATPGKKLQKEENDKTEKGRIIQGEKGIGRFAMLKLGKKIDVISKTLNDKFEHVLHYDFSRYDTEFLTENEEKKDLFLEDLFVKLEQRKPEVIVQKNIVLGVQNFVQEPMGTVIEISHLNKGWTREKIDEVLTDVCKLQSFFENPLDNQSKLSKNKDSFSVYLYKDEVYQNNKENYREKISEVIENKAVLKITNGEFNSTELYFSFELNGKKSKIFFKSPEIQGLWLTKKYYKDFFPKEPNLFEKKREIECGPFSFAFYIFDFTQNGPTKYWLDKNDKELIRPHRIYLYRDGLRVYPYGDEGDDWLHIDSLRGTKSAGAFLSNDQVIGVVNISHSKNPNLKDKTNREGLIENGYATADFTHLLQIFLMYIKHSLYHQYQIDNERRENQRQRSERKLNSDIAALRELINSNKDAMQKLNEIEKGYESEKRFLTKRAETTENLAGVGLSVETASHDIMRMMNLAIVNLDSLINQIFSSSSPVDKNSLLKELYSIRGSLGFVHAQLKDIQLLFTSSKQRRRNIQVREVVEKVSKIYKNLADKEKVRIKIDEIPGSPLMAKTTDAVLLQLLLNLFDNSIYWLGTIDKNNKEILVTLDGDKCNLIFSDNGPGVTESDLPYIFEAFYSGKGEDGRGLGLYIARQLLERNDYSIDYADFKSEKKLSGANFVVSFIANKE